MRKITTIGLFGMTLLIGIGLGVFITKIAQQAQPTVALRGAADELPELTLFMRICPGVPVAGPGG